MSLTATSGHFPDPAVDEILARYFNTRDHPLSLLQPVGTTTAPQSNQEKDALCAFCMEERKVARATHSCVVCSGGTPLCCNCLQLHNDLPGCGSHKVVLLSDGDKSDRCYPKDPNNEGKPRVEGIRSWLKMHRSVEHLLEHAVDKSEEDLMILDDDMGADEDEDEDEEGTFLEIHREDGRRRGLWELAQRGSFQYRHRI